MSLSSGIITFTSDFGSRDGYVGTVKGVILSNAPQVTIVDISHEIAPYCINDAAWVIFTSCRYFPQGTVHMVVVDPAVGSSQRRVLLTNGAYSFLGPDNGVFTWILANHEYLPSNMRDPWEAYKLTNSSLWLPETSSTFHARDIFAPVAAHIANGMLPSFAGEAISVDSLERLPMEVVETNSEIIGQVVYVDHYGNLITNIRSSRVESNMSVIVGQEVIETVQKSYSSVNENGLIALNGSHGFLEIAVNQGRADERLKVKAGFPIKILTTD